MKSETNEQETERRGTSALTRLLAPREILFRGQSVSCDSWHYGDYFRIAEYGETEHIIKDCGIDFIVDSQTVTQFIGERAIHEKEIYEGDILEISSRGLDFNCIVGRRGRLIPNDEFSKKWQHMLYRPDWENAKIIGNVFENPGLIE